MLFPSFGQEIAQEMIPIKQLMAALRGSGKITLTSIESQLLLREAYDNHFRIATHENPARPMSLVAKQMKETIGPYSRQARLYRRFASLNVGQLFNISITEFMNLPREQVEAMFEIAEEKSSADDRNNTNLQRQLEKVGVGGMGPMSPH